VLVHAARAVSAKESRRRQGTKQPHRLAVFRAGDLTARISALRQLVLQVPAPVIADALGFHHTTTTRQHVNAGATWSRYAGGGDHRG